MIKLSMGIVTPFVLNNLLQFVLNIFRNID